MTDNMKAMIVEKKMIELFGKRKEDMTLGELLEAISVLGALTGNEAVEEAANYTLGIAIRNGDADKKREPQTDCPWK